MSPEGQSPVTHSLTPRCEHLVPAPLLEPVGEMNYNQPRGREMPARGSRGLSHRNDACQILHNVGEQAPDLLICINFNRPSKRHATNQKMVLGFWKAVEVADV